MKDLLRTSHGYNVKVQILKIEKEPLQTLSDKKLTLVKAQVGDETAKANLLLRVENPDFYK